MGLISTLKSILGVDGRPEREGEPTVTVEHEPEASAERAVTESEPEPVTSAGEATDDGAEDAGTERPPEAAAEGSDEPVETITGIGPAYAGRLADAGIETVGDLAAADAAAVAEHTDIAETRVRGWVEQARGE